MKYFHAKKSTIYSKIETKMFSAYVLNCLKLMCS